MQFRFIWPSAEVLRLPVADEVIEVIVRVCPIPVHRQVALRACLQEALQNALVYGNMALAALPAADGDAQIHDVLAALLLQQPECADFPITLKVSIRSDALTVAVTDMGRGNWPQLVPFCASSGASDARWRYVPRLSTLFMVFLRRSRFAVRHPHVGYPAKSARIPRKNRIDIAARRTA